MWRKNNFKIFTKEKDEEYGSRKKEFTSLKDIQPHLKILVLFTTSLMIWFLFLLVFSAKRISNPIRGFLSTHSPVECKDNYSVYIYNLPSKFNFDLLEDCSSLNIYTDMCPHVTNNGMGKPLPEMGSSSWYTTHQLIGELIVHARIENHPCRTEDAEKASLFYVPFYGGLHASSKFREPNYTIRDALAVELVEYVEEQKWWKRNNGRDHFMAFGRTAWDFMRTDDVPDFGANKLLNMSPVQNMSVLLVERHPWEGHNQHGIPYPSYFHPSALSEMIEWQDRVSYMDRPHLFSFVGAPRTGKKKVVTRDRVIKQCEESSKCLILKCGKGPSKCHKPRQVLNVMMKSNFCLQVLGDSYTRRSTFDSILAGCIPVFFSNHTAYSQYQWFLPSDPTTYSVYIDLERNHSIGIEEELLKIPMEEVERMRRTVIQLIPTLTYAHPNSTSYGFRDAVDVALKGLSLHVTSLLKATS
ncbi:probable xyloglucan galactosyltransferase GT17 [Nicotiana sylvestris]|uniref:Xyloglucan galactosyltransferase KATAMARI1 n=1 Tax=Nicotiana sylvestris TaxID=4096 RepID=A0A1U7X8W0_NICSY|nr:PREDICTED: xyloglucan galactosyltransferase KATAMARI1 [Nicotiana sylvestris]